jgi:hypothetical protein
MARGRYRQVPTAAEPGVPAERARAEKFGAGGGSAYLGACSTDSRNDSLVVTPPASPSVRRAQDSRRTTATPPASPVKERPRQPRARQPSTR